MSYAGSRSSAASSGRALTRTHPGEPFLHGRLWDDPGARPPRRSSSVEHNAAGRTARRGLPAAADDRRRLESYNTGVQTGGYTSPLRRGETIVVAPEDGARFGVTDGEARRASSSRRSSVEAPVHYDETLRPGLAFMSLHFPTRSRRTCSRSTRPTPSRAPRNSRRRRSAWRRVLAWTSACSSATDRGTSARRSTPSSASARRTDSRVAPRRPRRRGTSCCRAARRERRVGWISRARSATRRGGSSPSGRGVRRRELLRADLPRGATGRVLHVCDRPLRAGSKAGRGAGRRAPVPCLGLCERAPASLPHGRRASEPREVATAARPAPPLPQAASRASGFCAGRRRVDPESSTSTAPTAATPRCARASSSARAASCARSPSRSCSAAAAPRSRPARKWEAVANQPAQPALPRLQRRRVRAGTFKDRVLMEDDPFALVEAMTIAAYATGCEQGFVYVRGGVSAGARRLENAIAQARDAACSATTSWAPASLRRRDAARRRRLCLRRGDRALQFDRGLPRRAAQQAAVPGRGRPLRQADGGQQRRDARERARRRRRAAPRTREIGTAGRPARGSSASPATSRGRASTRCRSARRCASCSSSRAPRAAEGGPARRRGRDVRSPDELDLPLTFEDARAAGATLGSGVVMVFDDDRRSRRRRVRIAAFFRDESCGQCVPCRVGTVRQEEALQRLAAAARERQRARSRSPSSAQAMRDASICGLGQTASSAVETAIMKLGVFARDDRSARRAEAPRRADDRRRAVRVPEGATILDACRCSASTRRRSASPRTSRP